MKFWTAYDRPGLDVCPYEDCPESMTETAGYIPTERLVQSFEEAGIRLEITRDFEFPGAEDVPEGYMPANFSSRLDALALDTAVKQRLMAHLEATKAAHGVGAVDEVVQASEPKEAANGAA